MHCDIRSVINYFTKSSFHIPSQYHCCTILLIYCFRYYHYCCKFNANCQQRVSTLHHILYIIVMILTIITKFIFVVITVIIVIIIITAMINFICICIIINTMMINDYHHH